MHLWMPSYAGTTNADPQGDSRAVSEGPVDSSPLRCCNFGSYSWHSLPPAREGQKILQRLFLFSDYNGFVLFGTSGGIMLVYRDSLIVKKKERLDRPNQSSIWTI